MLDLGDFAIVNVRIHRELRRRGMAAGSAAPATARRRNVDLVECQRHRNVDNSGCWKHRHVGNVRLRLEQYRLVVDPNVNVAHNAGGGARTGIRWDPPRLAILELVPQRRYRRTAYCPRWVRGKFNTVNATMPIVTSPPIASSTAASTVGNTFGTRPGSNPSGSTLSPTGPGS